MSRYLEAAATLDRQRADDLKATDAQLSESQQLLASLQHYHRGLGACSQCHEIVREHGHLDGCPFGESEDTL